MPSTKCVLLALFTVMIASKASAQDCDAKCIQAVRERLDSVEKRLASRSDGLPTGTIIAYSGQGLPGGFLAANGDTLLATDPENVALCAALSDRFKLREDPVGTCRLPNLDGRVLAGADTAHPLGRSFGRATAQLEIKHMPAHTHQANFPIYAFTGNAGGLIGPNNSVVAGFPYTRPNHSQNPDDEVRSGLARLFSLSNVGAGEAFEILPPAVSIRYLVKR